MKLFLWKSPEGNFGDDLNEWIWDHLLPGWQDWDSDVTLFGVGTLLNRKNLTNVQGQRILVAGTGAGYGTRYTGPVSPEWDIRALRGPLSAKALGLDEAIGLIDPAIMIPEFPEFRDLPRSGRPLFVPHIASARRHDWKTACDRLGIDFIAPSEDSKQVIRALAGASVVLAESMHAAILADAFRVPWIPGLDLRHVQRGQVAGLGAEPRDAGRHPAAVPEDRPAWRHAPKLPPESRPCRRSGPGRRRRDSDSVSSPRYQQSLHQRMRVRMESAVLTSALRRAMKRSSQLSDGERLQQKRNAYRRVLEDIRRDYGSKAYGKTATPLRVRSVA